MEKEQNQSTEEFIDKLYEEDEEFQEFDITKEWVEKERETETKTSLKWDDDDIEDDLSLQLKKELENNSKKD